PSLEAFRLLDNLALVARDPNSTRPGRLVYYGPAYPDAVSFFNPDGIPSARAGTDPAPEELLRGLARRTTQEWAETFAVSPYQHEDGRERDSRPPQGPDLTTASRPQPLAGVFQWWTLVRRCLAVKLSDPLHTAILLAQAPAIAILIVLVYGRQL